MLIWHKKTCNNWCQPIVFTLRKTHRHEDLCIAKSVLINQCQIASISITSRRQRAWSLAARGDHICEFSSIINVNPMCLLCVRRIVMKIYASPKVNSEKLLSRKLHKICTLRHTSKEKEKKMKLTGMSSAKTIFPLGKWFRFPCPDPGQDIISRIERYIRVNSVEMIIRKVRFFKILV